MQDKVNAPEEILDLVDENDQIIGEISKGEANGRPGLIHREVAVLIYDDKNRLLLQQRSFKKKVHPGVWSVTCAGHVSKGIEPLQAAHRELREELGLDTDLVFIRKFTDHLPTETRIFYLYLGRFPGGSIKINKDEVEQARFFTKEEFEERNQRGEMGKLSSFLVGEFWSGKLDALKEKTPAR